jgi:sucrose-6-phosphate hydrolase SacC (GH32 family)
MNLIAAMVLTGAGFPAYAADEPLTDGHKTGAPAVYGEKHRPQFHFSPKVNWTNDPNGLVFYMGEYHLFFQHNPSGINWGNMTWGHAVSKDLVHWTQLDHAILPDRLGSIFSGSAVVDWENTSGFGSADSKAMVCIYTAAGEHNTAGEKGVPYTQCLASTTDGRTFTKYAKNPVLGHLAGSNRDPKVIWYAPEKKWVMALYLAGDTFALFESKDLKSWTKLHDVRFPRHSECPDFFPMPVDGNKDNLKWVFTAANGDYLIGSFDGKTFKPEGDATRADYGANYYAVQTYSDIPASDGRRIQIAWMAEARYPGMPFNQQMGFPCEMKLRTFPEGLRICRLPVAEIKNVYGKHHTWKDQTLKPDENLLKDVAGGLYDIQLQVDPAGAKSFGIKCRGATVTYSAERAKLACLGKEAPMDAPNGKITLRILVDRTSLEVFANDGKVVMTSCFLPTPEMTGLECFAEGGNPKILSMTVDELKSAWPTSK